jgi:hypothetical protein
MAVIVAVIGVAKKQSGTALHAGDAMPWDEAENQCTSFQYSFFKA